MLGEINIDINDVTSVRKIKFKDIIYSQRLTSMTHSPTRVTMITSSIIDLILSTTNSTGFNVNLCGTHDPDISDHHLIYAVN